ncbi:MULTISPECIES: YlbE-like family protein [Coprobacillaceae]|uniref:YlbE-like family protein n=1 Tax=Coprobacillaceae TaxID=2810280 RepID=UPI000E51D335|nr:MULTISPECIES: YlbE-like family protein [Coprobacillaceae]RHM62152.1 hypothetical protein DWZ53_03765 [Coprobacillus sp. AF33-1AC]RHS96029.1 hypothetical protein DW911_01460 [Erysipelatoclostridium sp. AM42-17]
MTKNDVYMYLRYHPQWYIVLSRYPERYQDLLEEMKQKQNNELIDKLDKLSLFIQMMEMLK